MNRTVFVTGGVRNTGLAIARRFAREGWNVAISSRDARAAAETAEKEARAGGGGEWLGVGMDPARVDEIRGAIEAGNYASFKKETLERMQAGDEK